MIFNCVECGTQFKAKPGRPRKFCSGGCYHANATSKGHQAPERLTVFNCATCGKAFSKQPGELRAYRKAHGKDPLYCSRPCGWEGKKLTQEEWEAARVTCVQCGKLMPIQRRPGGTLNKQKRLCSTECRSLFRSLNHKNGSAASGKFNTRVRRDGYIWVMLPAYVSGAGKRKEMLEHRYVMQQMLGRPLRQEETVHHRNGQRTDNRPQNLELRSGRHGPGGDVGAMIRWAHEFIALYPQFDADGTFHPHEIGELRYD